MRCDHDWPGDLEPDTPCPRCGLAYGEWTQPEPACPQETARDGAVETVESNRDVILLDAR